MPEPLTPDQLKQMMNIDHMVKKNEKNDQVEAKMQRAFCQWLGMQFPNVYFTSDASSLGAGWNTIRNIKATKSSHAHLDLVILCPKQGQYHGLVLEFKKESPYLLSGELSREKHIQDQLKTMQLLRAKNYKCEWAWTLEMAIDICTEYLGQPVITNETLFP